MLADYGAAKNTADSLNNGLDFEPWPGCLLADRSVNAALAAGRSSKATVDEHVAAHPAHAVRLRVLRPRRLRRRRRADRQARPTPRAAQRIEEAAITLLRRTATRALPLDASKLKSIALIGAGRRRVQDRRRLGERRAVRVRDAARRRSTERAGNGVTVRYDDGSDPRGRPRSRKAADVAIVVAADYQSEGADRAA